MNNFEGLLQFLLSTQHLRILQHLQKRLHTRSSLDFISAWIAGFHPIHLHKSPGLSLNLLDEWLHLRLFRDLKAGRFTLLIWALASYILALETSRNPLVSSLLVAHLFWHDSSKFEKHANAALLKSDRAIKGLCVLHIWSTNPTANNICNQTVFV